MNTDHINVLIIDDEPIARDILETYVQKLSELQVVGMCKNALEAFRIISQQQVDLLLLDINMPEINGMDFLRTLKKPPLVIFTTAYAEYAIESYELNAVDYLLKPVSFERFMKGIHKAIDILRSDAKTVSVQNTATHVDNLMFVKAEGKLVRIDLAELWFAEGLKDYVRLWTDKGKIIVHSTMKNFEEQLAAYPNFMRVHKSYIINVKYIAEVDGNSLRIKDQLLTIGNTYRDETFAILNKYKLL
jgi:DNA-binding LytR/AlgR family response regulator